MNVSQNATMFTFYTGSNNRRENKKKKKVAWKTKRTDYCEVVVVVAIETFVISF